MKSQSKIIEVVRGAPVSQSAFAGEGLKSIDTCPIEYQGEQWSQSAFAGEWLKSLLDAATNFLLNMSQSAFAGEWLKSGLVALGIFLYFLSQSAFAGEWLKSTEPAERYALLCMVAIRFRWRMVEEKIPLVVLDPRKHTSQSAFAGEWLKKHYELLFPISISESQSAFAGEWLKRESPTTLPQSLVLYTRRNPLSLENG